MSATVKMTETFEPLKLSDEDMLQEIIRKTDQIHTSFLFWGPGVELFQKLSINLCATPTSNRYNGWVELGVELKLDRLEVLSIKNTLIMKEDPVYVMLLAYTQKENSLVSNIFRGLSKIGRKDVICQTYPTVLKFHEDISKRFTTTVNGIYMPPRQPEVPHIFKDFELTTKIKEGKVSNLNKIEGKKYKKIVLLTYAAEDADIAANIAKEFRKEQNGVFIGVLTLNEHPKEVLENREKLIYKFHSRADYIIPIVTMNYLRHISSDNILGSCLDNLDGTYAAFIYDQMMHNYLKNGCRNKNVRCIIPDYDFENVQNHNFFQAMFQAWTKLSDISIMAKCILKGTI